MLKSLLMELFGHAGVFLIPAAVIYGAYCVSRRAADLSWLLAFLSSVLSLGVLLVFQARQLTDDDPANDLADPTYVTYLIVALFVTALTINAKTVWKVGRELEAERNGQEGATRRALRSGLAPAASPGAAIDEALAEIDALLDAREDVPRLIRRILPTLGLIGTVIGLGMSMAALGGALAAAIGEEGGDSALLLTAMQSALAGMGGAFITTLFGAGFGMFLMVMTTRTRVLLTQLLVTAKRGLEEEAVKKQAETSPPKRARFHPDMN